MYKFSNFDFFVCFLSIVFHISEAVSGSVMQKSFPSSFGKFKGKHLYWGLLFTGKDLQVATLINKTPTKVFSEDFTNFLRTPVLQNIFKWLLLPFKVWYSVDGGFYQKVTF